jgi:hypothetical protein
MTARIKSLAAFMLAAALVLMTLSAIFPRGDEGSRGDESSRDIIIVPAQSGGSAEEDGDAAHRQHKQDDASPFLYAGEVHDNTQHTNPSTEETPYEEPVSPTREGDLVKPHHSISQGSPNPHDGPQTKDFRILVGVMTPFESGARRQITRNGYHNFPKDLPVDVWYVISDAAVPWDHRYPEKTVEAYRVGMEWENKTNHDILCVDGTENMDQGKT